MSVRGPAERLAGYPTVLRPSATGGLSFFAALGMAFLLFTIYIYGAWIFSGHFKPVDPGPDPIPAMQNIILIVLQVVGTLLTVWMVWHFVVKPKRRNGSFSTDGLIIIGLLLSWWGDPLTNYTNDWLAYNAHLLNMGSWAGSTFPGWSGAYGDRMPEPLVTGLGWIFWFFGAMLIGAWVMRKVVQRFPTMSFLQFMMAALVFSALFDFVAEEGALHAGWYNLPGAWRAISLQAGTMYQLPLIEIFAGTLQTMGYIVFYYFKDDRGRTFVERGAETLRIPDRAKTFVRFLAIYGILCCIPFLYNIPNQWTATHSDQWVPGLPSYFTTQCPAYKTDPASCGGPGIPMHRPDYNWLP